MPATITHVVKQFQQQWTNQLAPEAILTAWPSENERVMSGKVAILPPEVESKTTVCGTSSNTLVHAISKG